MLPSQVPRLDDQLGNQSGDRIGVVSIRWKNDLGTLQKSSLLIVTPAARSLLRCIFRFIRKAQMSPPFRHHMSMND